MPEQPRRSASPQAPIESARPHVHTIGSLNLRHRGPTRAATFAEGTSSIQDQRRNSSFSDSVSEARNSIRSSTDELLFPRVVQKGNIGLPNEESNWQSAPLGLALLPAIAGIFFKNGSAVVTDITLLILAAIFLNWSVRLPWEWYRSAQALKQEDIYYDSVASNLELETDENGETCEDRKNATDRERRRERQVPSAANEASKELQIHEVVALASCFIFPVIGTWLLHAIRSKLSRPSEGLVSNYNLTIFLLASEIRPFAHLLKMVQARTLHLQRVVAASADDEEKLDPKKIKDLAKRLEELEAHVAETAAARLPSGPSNYPQDQELPQNLISQATAEIRKGFQPEIDALNRAVRRYEKRTALTSFQTEAKFQALETQVHDAIALAAAAQRSGSRRPLGTLSGLFNSIYAIILLPVQIFMSLASLPFQLSTRCLQYCKDMLVSKPPRRSSKGKVPRDLRTSSRQFRRIPPQDLGGGPALKPIREYQ
ncbi:hypothetical protein ALT_6617 [Aspergillus lentulus]|uniref:Uncharacterized protein n=1 Tax=Aspergillus lentulus TaxID=293939 RepID=A0AAN6BMH5_ASPLE|nr:hypothetical protein CNMCM6069_001228 [Aspergillus lentulus]KAF4163206.1 hypothetical protein CNMCM6936_001068 [Aspergillus lentulus]KAF4181618.1 hypothetical protein CNMCM8060_008785 [Aspergillus lentulus]KAF4188690.1 hypothetical protein CNMCM7927_000864 [Aspergillus lentulus]KAF4192214.1 hypothetical protein CNMCM8694_000708 [Aspergillus lentulus]